jgi:hypothetical protein
MQSLARPLTARTNGAASKSATAASCLLRAKSLRSHVGRLKRGDPVRRRSNRLHRPGSARHPSESLTARADAPPRPCLLPQPSLAGLSENTRTVEIHGFVPRGQVDACIEKPYYIAPARCHRPEGLSDQARPKVDWIAPFRRYLAKGIGTFWPAFAAAKPGEWPPKPWNGELSGLMTRTPRAVSAREPTQQSNPQVAELEVRLSGLEQDLAAAQEKLAAANQEIERLKEAALQARRMAAGFA